MCDTDRLCQSGLKKHSMISMLQCWLKTYKMLSERAVVVFLFSVTLTILIIPFGKEIFFSWLSIEVIRLFGLLFVFRSGAEGLPLYIGSLKLSWNQEFLM